MHEFQIGDVLVNSRTGRAFRPSEASFTATNMSFRGARIQNAGTYTFVCEVVPRELPKKEQAEFIAAFGGNPSDALCIEAERIGPETMVRMAKMFAFHYHPVSAGKLAIGVARLRKGCVDQSSASFDSAAKAVMSVAFGAVQRPTITRADSNRLREMFPTFTQEFAEFEGGNPSVVALEDWIAKAGA